MHGWKMTDQIGRVEKRGDRTKAVVRQRWLLIRPSFSDSALSSPPIDDSTERRSMYKELHSSIINHQSFNVT